MKSGTKNSLAGKKQFSFFKKANSTKKNSDSKNSNQNISNANVKTYSKPNIRSNNKGIFVKKREFIQNIVPVDPFTPTKIEFNPGLSAMFPWLSGVAPNFEKYRVHKLSFIYETAQSTFIPGMVMFAPEFNISDDLPESKAELLEYAYATRAPVWKNFQMELPVSAIMNYRDYYIRVNELSVTNDKKLYDPFYLIYATDAVQEDISYAGEIWVEYEIELLYPQRIPISTLRFNSYKMLYFTSPTNDLPFTTLNNSTGGLLVSVQDGSKILFSESFTGRVEALVNVSNLGLATNFSVNPPSWSVVSDSGSITLHWAVGGASSGNTNPDFILLVFLVKNVIKGDLLQIANLGFDTGSGTIATSVQLEFQSGYVA
jgi:hypothetical protein